MIRFFSAAAPALALGLVVLLAGCGGGLSGTYEREDGLGSLEFKPDGTVYVTVLDATLAGEYEVDDDRIIIKGPNGSQVYTMKGDRLEAGRGRVFVRR